MLRLTALMLVKAGPSETESCREFKWWELNESFLQLSVIIVRLAKPTRTRVDQSSSLDKTNAGQTRENSRRLSTKIWAASNSMRAGESRRESPRAHERLRPNESESLNSHQQSLRLCGNHFLAIVTITAIIWKPAYMKIAQRSRSQHPLNFLVAIVAIIGKPGFNVRITNFTPNLAFKVRTCEVSKK